MSVLVMVIVMPLVRGYMRILSGLMGGLNINETLKKAVTLLFVMAMGVYLNEILYLGSFIYMTGGVLGGVMCGLYVFLALGARFWAILLLYIMPNASINDNYRMLTLGILPLIAFFVKICRYYLVL